MPEYLAPGVYIEELPPGLRPIEGVGTSTAGFVGQTERGPTAPRLVTSWLDYQRWFGRHIDPARAGYLTYAIQGFFENGGQRAFVARVTRSDAVAALGLLATSSAAQLLVVTAIGSGEFGNRLFVRVQNGSLRNPDGTSVGFRLTVMYYRTAPPLPLVDPTNLSYIANRGRRLPDEVEDYDDLGFNPEGPNYVLTAVNSSSRLVRLSWSSATTDAARPNNSTATPTTPPGGTQTDDGGFLRVTGGADGAANITATQYRGTVNAITNERTGLVGIEAIDEVSLVCVPDHVLASLSATSRVDILNEVVNQCERLKDRFAILSVEETAGDPAAILPPRDSSYAAIYHPWVRIVDPRTGGTLALPSVGHVAGIYARSDIERGVHKAPANEEVRGIITRDLNGSTGPLRYKLSKGEQDILNPRGVNVIRDFRADRRGVRVWGARTMSSDSQWKYINVRRLFLFLEESIEEGTQWVVFELNDEPLWARVRRSITAFLDTVWKNGALQGATQEEAFFVKCDRTTMSEDDILNGRLICLIGVAPVRPAEFVIFRFQQKTATAQA